MTVREELCYNSPASAQQGSVRLAKGGTSSGRQSQARRVLDLSTDPRKRELRNAARNKRRGDIADPHRMFWADIEEAARRVNSRQANDVRVIHIHGKASAIISRGINPLEIIIVLNSIR